MNVIIIGGGKTGSHLAHLILEEGHTVKIIEERGNVLEKLKGELSSEHIVPGNGSSPPVLEAAGIRAADVLAAVTGSDETNLVVTSLARFEFNVPRIIARINNPKNAWLFTPEMGVDAALNQADILAHLVAEEMSLGDMITLLKLRRGEFSLIEEKVHPQSPVASQAISGLAIPPDCTIVAVIRKNQLIIPKGNTILEEDDEIIALVHRKSLPGFAALLSPGQQ